MKITLSARDIAALSVMKNIGMSDSLKMFSKLQTLNLADARAYFRKHRCDIPLETALIIERNITAEERRIEAVRKRKAARKAAAKADAPKAQSQSASKPEKPEYQPAILTDAQRKLLKWIAANWKKISDFFSMQKHIDRQMSSRLASRYKELRALVVQAPAIPRLA